MSDRRRVLPRATAKLSFRWRWQRGGVPRIPVLPGLVLPGLVLLVLQAFLAGQRAAAQSVELPRAEHYAARVLLYDGELEEAAKGFRRATHLVLPDGSRWIDSACRHAMIGEALYQAGNNEAALEQFTIALNLAVAYPSWMLRVDYPDPRPAAASRRPATFTWGRPSRPLALSTVPVRYVVSLRLSDLNLPGTQVSRTVRVADVLYCLGLAQRRRRQLLGATAVHDPLTEQLVALYGRRLAPPNHWSQAWISVQLGLALSASGQTARAAAELRQGSLLLGQFDHTLTPLALLELGELADRAGQRDAALQAFHDATFAAAAFGQSGLMAEAFAELTRVHLQAGGGAVQPSLAAAVRWAHRKGRLLETTVQLALAENLLEAGNPGEASAALQRAQQLVARNDLAAGRLGSKLHFLLARLAFVQGSDGSAALAKCLAWEQRGNLRLFQTRRADRLYTSGTISARQALELYGTQLAPPEAIDWARDPQETLGWLHGPLEPILENWLEAALQRQDNSLALEIAERIRWERFCQTLPLQGRLLNLRWLLFGPLEELPPKAGLQRKQLLAAHPALARLAAEAERIQTAVGELPADDPEAGRRERSLIDELGDVVQLQEHQLRTLALSRAPGPAVFPPPFAAPQFQNTLPPRSLVWSLLATRRRVLAFAITSQQLQLGRLDSPQLFQRYVGSVLQALGNRDANAPLRPEDLLEPRWRAAAQTALHQLTKGQSLSWDDYDQLLVVPDGVGWYLPFEILPLDPKDPLSPPLLTRVAVRYAPLLALNQTRRGPTRPLAHTLIYPGQLMRDPAEPTAENVWSTLSDVAAHPRRLSSPLPGPLALSTLTGERLVVMSDQQARGAAASGLLPAEGAAGGTWQDWMRLPLTKPSHLVFPGYHTAAESGLRRGGDGSELFLAACAALAGGSRSALLARWRVGGKSAQDLVREYVQELPHASASRAWQRSVQLNVTNALVPDEEPRLSKLDTAVPLKMDHPFFWAGYLVIERQAAPAD